MSHVSILNKDCLDALKEMSDNSIDAIVTDPPYGLEFMGKEWDAFRPQRDPRTAGRSGAGAVVGGAGIGNDTATPGGRSRVAFGGKRPSTWRCDTCGIRNQFRNAHRATAPDCDGTWVAEVIDPDAPSPLLPFQRWCEQWATECLRVLKPGGHLLAFGGTRTWHRLVCAVEDAGFEVRDSIAWLYGSGFPKSLDVSKAIDKAAGAEREVTGPGQYANRGRVPSGSQVDVGESVGSVVTAPATPDAQTWQGWGTALKPAHEPIVVARKPLSGTVAANVLAHGTGALNVDGCRIDAGEGRPLLEADYKDTENSTYAGRMNGSLAGGSKHAGVTTQGRWPANVILDESQAAALDEQNGGASRFFYVAKAPKKERPDVDGVKHPTVKPLTLMRYLVRLVTPPDGTVLDPFAGSGSTVEACILEGFSIIGVEREAEYLPLIQQRIDRATEQ